MVPGLLRRIAAAAPVGPSTLLLALVLAVGAPTDAPAQQSGGGFTEAEIIDAATGVFGATAQGLATVIERIFQDQGRPSAYISGEEISGAFIVGLRYGKGQVVLKGAPPRPIFWQGPSVGFDFGGNAAKVFVLVYGVEAVADLHRRFPGVEGSFYFIAGLGVNYQAGDGITLAPIRTGMGLRQGAAVGYLHYGPRHSWVPF